MKTELENAIRNGDEGEIRAEISDVISFDDHQVAGLIIVAEAIVAERESRPSQQTIDAVVMSLAGWAMITHAVCPEVNPFPVPLLTLLGIDRDADWAAGVLETHHDGAAELVDALRQMKIRKGEDDAN